MTPVKLTYEVELEPGERLELPAAFAETLGPGRWAITVTRIDPQFPTATVRDHTAFLNGYAPEDEGLYDDDPAR